MTDIVAAEFPAPSDAAPVQMVKMRCFGLGERSTLPISVATAVVIVVAWWAVSEARLVSHLFLPTPREVFSAAIAFYRDGYANASMLEHVGASLMRILAAAAIAIALGVPVGLLMGLNRWAKGVFDAPIEFYWPLPPLAYLPLMIIWLGIGEVSKIALLAMAMFAPIALSAPVRFDRARQRGFGSRRHPTPALARDHFSLSASRNPDRHPHRAWRRMGNSGRRRVNRRDPRNWPLHHVRVAVPRHRLRVRRHRRHCSLRLRLLVLDANDRALARAVEGAELIRFAGLLAG